MIDQSLGNNIIQLLTGFIILTTLFLYMSNSTRRFVISYIWQSLLIAGLVAFIAYFTVNTEMYFIAIIIVAIKVIIVPYVLVVLIKKIALVEEKEPFVNIASSLLIAGILVILSYFLIEPILAQTSSITKSILPFSVAIVLIGFYILVSKKKANTQIFGFLCMENGLYLSTIATTYGMPLVIELGVFLDVFIGIIIMAFFMMQIHKKFETIDTSMLQELKEE
jgi:hydrogenase-4 component E